MKTFCKNSLMLCLLASVAWLTSCTDDVLVDVAEPTTTGNRLTLSVSQDTPESRLELGQDGLTTLWEAGDQLVMVRKDGTQQAPIYLNCTLDPGTKADYAEFVSEGGVPAGDYWVIYNYNENLAYTHQPFSSVDEINEHDKLVMYGTLNVTASTTSYSLNLQHLYAKVSIKLENLPSDSNTGYYYVGMYSSKKGMPIYKQFTQNGLVNAEYGIHPNSNNYNTRTFFPSDRRQHNIRFGEYYVDYTYNESDGTYTPSNLTLLEANSALILPEDLSGEDVFFYVIRQDGGEAIIKSQCFEVKKAIGKVNLQAGTSYTVILDLEDPTTTVETTLNLNYYNCEVSTPAEWRHAVYASVIGLKVKEDIDFSNDYFFPISCMSIEGNEKTLRNINLEWDEDNIGLHRLDGVDERTSVGYGISNLTLENVTFKGRSYVGAFGGCNKYLSNCKVIGTSTISGTGDYVGGMVGWNRNEEYLKLNDVSIEENCTVSGVNYVGGIVGAYRELNYFGSGTFGSSIKTLDNCTSHSTVIAEGNYAGGIFGIIGEDGGSSLNFNSGEHTYSLVECQNFGNVSGNNYVGGIGGAFTCTTSDGSIEDKIVIKQSLSEGTVNGDSYVGGILGCSYASINTCYSINNINATTSVVGGIVGETTGIMYRTRIANCYSLANLTVGPNGIVGGIVGNAGLCGPMIGTTITNSYYAAESIPTGCGIVGSSDGYCTVTNCLTTLSSLGNLDTNNTDNIANSETSVQSILAKRDIINIGVNAYSENYWPLDDYPWYCVTFASFSAGTGSEDFKQGSF